MLVDVSEIKSARDCRRKWAMSSRNYFHMQPRAENPNLRFGSLFHEGLAGLYLSGGDEEQISGVIEKYVRETDESLQPTMRTMLRGYADKILMDDLLKYTVLEIEHKFSFSPPEELITESWQRELKFCGSIDMVVLDSGSNTIYGFEHKSCKNFRTPFYNSVDEQPRMYYIALKEYVKECNRKYGTNFRSGGVYINETRKLKTRFEHSRLEPIEYSESQCESFLRGCLLTSSLIHYAESQNLGALPPPEPGYLKCTMCDFKETCEHYGYERPSKEEILEEFSEELRVRECDHLEEKVEIKNKS